MKSIMTIACIALLSGCGSDKTADKAAKMRLSDSDIAGGWKSNCAAADILGLAFVQKEFNSSILGDFDKTERYSANNDCTDVGLKYHVVGTYAAFDSDVETGEVTRINFTIDRAMLTVGSEAILKVLNGTNFCGKSDWVLNKEVGITGLDCPGFTVNQGDVIFDVYQVKNDRLYFGQKLFMLSDDDASSRPESVGTDVIYQKR